MPLLLLPPHPCTHRNYINTPLDFDHRGVWEVPAIPASPHEGSWIDAAALHGTGSCTCANAYVKVAGA